MPATARIESTNGCAYETVRDRDLNYAMGLGDEEIIDDGESPPRINTMFNEHGQLWFYRNWAAAVSARAWPQPAAAAKYGFITATNAKDLLWTD